MKRGLPAFPTDRKILSRAEARSKAAELRAQGQKLVLANGCFDVLHVGHVRYLEAAGELGDVLFVGINADGSVRRLKGEGRPLEDENQRASLVAALRPVDYVVLFHEETADVLLEEISPDFHAKGTDYTQESVPERETALRIGAKIAIVGDPKGHSTATLIEAAQRQNHERE